jgi:hypothetical protein
MKIPPQVLTLALAVAASQLYAEAVSKSYTGSGTVDSVDVEASVKTTVKVFPAGSGKDEDDPFEPYPVAANWTVTWDSATPDAAAFKADLTLGDYYTVTDAGTMGGVSIQSAHNVTHHIGGTARWDAATRTLSYEVPLKKRKDGRASKVSMDADPTCEGAKIACSAFLNTSAELEGLTVQLTFDENRDSFTGKMSATQYEGAAFTRNQTDMNISVKGELEAAQ